MEPSLQQAAARLAELLTGRVAALSDPAGRDLIFEDEVTPRPLERRPAPADVWAVDGGQCVVADARCVRLLVTRAARVRYGAGERVLEDEGELKAHLLGVGEDRASLAALELGIDPSTSVDANLLRDRWEWDAVERAIDEAQPGALVLVDGDLVPDWRIPSTFMGELLERSAERKVLVAGVTKHSSLARGGAPLVGQLELEAAVAFGARAMWWAPVARTRSDFGAGGLQVVVARLDPDARFAFRIDLPALADPEQALGALSALSDDAAFPGYPYPLSVADQLAACPPWLRQELWLELDELFHRAGVPVEVRERAFADRHKLMERA
ncbi:MAG: DNA double-strand break repair nuclease NurA [Acidimicrobiia bacterium]|nr:DNA double-strand break repair nuclease NurA [Acidimicrobiia bacterium]